MLDMRAAIADLCNEIGSSFQTKASIGDFIGALGAALEDGTAALYMGITSDTVYLEIRSQGRSSGTDDQSSGAASDQTGAGSDQPDKQE